ncbi:MAG TPA: hypothetical protein VGM90_34245 [Kofleriaceae bacterium]|jgi:hypothetical protein
MNARSLSLLLALSITGCSAASGVVGALMPKPQPTVVITNSNVVGSSTVAAQTAPQKSVMEKVGIVTTGAVMGAAVGALVGRGTHHEMTSAAALGAGVGVLAGVALARN